jgi:hypothetical protein
MAYTLVGALHAIMDEQTINAKLRKREFVVKFAENVDYPQLVKFELINDRCRLVDGFSLGQEVEISFSIKGREWVNPKGEKTYFVSLEAFRLGQPGRGGRSDEGREPSRSAPRASQAPAASSADADPFADSDLPF